MYFYIIGKDGYIKYGVYNDGYGTAKEYEKLNVDCKVIESEKLDDVNNYRLVNDKLVRMTDEEIREKSLYGKILTDAERLEKEEERKIEMLKPSRAEIEKAEMQLMILNTLEAVNEQNR